MRVKDVLLLSGAVSFLMVGGCAAGEAQKPAAASMAAPGETMSAGAAKTADPVTRQTVSEIMNRVAAWQYAQYDPQTNLFNDDPSADGHPQGWVYAVLHTGLVAHARSVGTEQDWARLKAIAERNAWGFAPRFYNADDYAVGQLYLDLAEHYGDTVFAASTRERLLGILAHPPQIDLAFIKTGKHEMLDGREWGIAPCKDRWCWCDALFMAPPVWMKWATMSGDMKFADFADKEFWATTDYLYDKDEKLYYRDSRYFDQRESNGAKVFWGRGNGWTFAGITRILDQMPADYARRGDYERIFRDIAGRLAGLQTKDGYWRSSLLGPQTHENPETSGTALMVYGLAWGVNHGLLDRAEFSPVILRGWQGLARAVHEDGKLGWVQQVASQPGKASYDDSQLYGVGGFLMAGEQMLDFIAADNANMDSGQ